MFRYIAPVESDWIEGDTIEDVQDHHLRNMENYSVSIPDPYGERFGWYLARVEFEDGEKIVSRCTYHGIGRSGGVNPKGEKYTKPLQYAARNLGVEVEEIDFPDEEWEHAEIIEETFERRLRDGV